jgi:hypothetical protein
MTKRTTSIGLVLLVASLSALACGRGQTPEPDAMPTPYPTYTPYPTPVPPSGPVEPAPSTGELASLVEYANSMAPLLTEAGEVLERDGEILKAAEGGNDAVLCDGRLESDNSIMKGIIADVRRINPPTDAAAIHDLVLQSGEAWTEALDNVEEFCDTGNQFYKIPAVLKFWEAAATLQDAGNRFWLLVVSEGIEDWVTR